MGFFSREHRTQVEQDTFQAWLYATNCRLYERDPGPAMLNIGTQQEPVHVDRVDAWRDSYAQSLLIKLDADHARLDAAGALARQQFHELRGWSELRHLAEVFWRRLQPVQGAPGRSLRHRLGWALQVLRVKEREDFATAWQCAIDLCQRAGRMVEQTDAVNDDAARQRLLAGARHRQRVETLGFIPGQAERSAHKLIQELGRIDHQHQRDDG